MTGAYIPYTVQKENMSSLSDSNKHGNKAQKTDDEGRDAGNGSVPTLADVLRKRGRIIRNLVAFTSVPQTSRLLITCTELYTGEKVVLQKLPKVCDMSSRWDRDGNEFKLYGAMLRVPNSRWLEWLDTSGVEELRLPSSVTDEEMLIMFGGGRFSGVEKVECLEV